MIDQKVTENGRDGGRQRGDPLGVEAALGPGDGASGNQSAASAAEVFAQSGREPAGQASGRAGADIGTSGVHMMETAGSIGGGAVSATRDVLRGAIGATEDVASGLVGGVSHVAAGIVHGVRDVGYEVRDGATGLIGAVGTVGGTAVQTVAHLLVDVVDGVRQVVGAAMGHNGNGQQRRIDLSQPEQTAGQAQEYPTGAMPSPGASEARDTSAAPRR